MLSVMHNPGKPWRGFTAVEVAAVAAMAGIVAAAGVASVNAMLAAERSRNTAARLATDIAQMRSDAIGQQMYSQIELAPSAGGVTVTFVATRLGSSPTTSPCVDLSDGVVKTGDSVRTARYENVAVDVTTSTGATPTQQCFDHQGRPLDSTGSAALTVSFGIRGATGSGSASNLAIDASGIVTSSIPGLAAGIAKNDLHPKYALRGSSAPVMPNVADAPPLPTFETAPGATSTVAGGDAEQTSRCDDYVAPDLAGGGSWPYMAQCGCGAPTCIYECQYTHCPAPCDVCYHDCCFYPAGPLCAAYKVAHPEYDPTLGCPYNDPYVGCP